MDEMQRDTDAGFLAWLMENPDEMQVLLAVQNV